MARKPGDGDGPNLTLVVGGKKPPAKAPAKPSEPSSKTDGEAPAGRARRGAGNTRDRTSSRALSAAEKQTKALDLRRQGHDYESIAALVGYANKSGAYKAVMAGLDATRREPADEVRALELARLDRMQRGLAAKADKGDTGAIYASLKVMERRAKLLGLDREAPTVDLIAFVSRMADQYGLDSERRSFVIAMAVRLFDESGGDVRTLAESAATIVESSFVGGSNDRPVDFDDEDD